MRSTSYWAALSAVLLTMFLGLALSCESQESDDDDSSSSDDDDDDDEGADDDAQVSDDDTEWQEDCGDNSPPVLLSIAYAVNGLEQSGPVVVDPDDLVELLLEYADVDCNLSGYAIINTPDSSITPGSFDADPGCSSEQEGGPYRLAVAFADFPGPPGGPFLLEIFDKCGEASDRLEILLDWNP